MDKLIIGAGLYGLYAALYCAKKGQQVEVLEMEEAPFTRATYINQARVHMGYHYPRSLSTAMKSAGYFKRFTEDYSFCLHTAFQQIYATSAHFSWTDAAEFLKFCRDGFFGAVAPDLESHRPVRTGLALYQAGLCLSVMWGGLVPISVAAISVAGEVQEDLLLLSRLGML